MQSIQWVKDHWDALLACQQALFIFLSLVCELLGKSQLSKWFGTYATVDAGRLIRNAKTKAIVTNGALLIGLVLLTGCNLFGAKLSTPCDGLYCLEVTEVAIPGSALLCYKTEALALQAKAKLEAEGKKATLVK